MLGVGAPGDVRTAFVDPSEVEAPQCWICFGGDEGDLIAPCQCTGSMRWIHRRCLDQWRVSATNPRFFTNCRHCNSKFRMVLQRNESQILDAERSKRRRRRILGQAAKHCFLGTVLSQAGLFGLAALIRLSDPERSLPEQLGLQDWGTYYLAAVILTLFFVGLFGTCVVCCRPQSNGAVDRVFDDVGTGCHHCCGPQGALVCCDSGWCIGDCCSSCCIFDGDTCCGAFCRGGPGLCSGCDLSSCGFCTDSLGGLAMLCLLIVLLFVFVGAIYVLMLLVAWVGRTAQRYMQLRELRELTGEYVVQDLSATARPTTPSVAAASAPTPQVEQALAPMAQNMTVEVVPSAPMAQDLNIAHVEDPVLERNLRQDLQAIYGLDEEVLVERLQAPASQQV